MKNKAIFGGTFDPIHNGHLQIAYEALDRLNLDCIIFMPSGNPPHKTNKTITDAKIRVEMIEKVIQDEKKFHLSTYEIERSDLSYTYKTLQHFSEKEPETKWYFLTGADCLINIDTWYNVEEIFNNCNFVVFNRIEYDKEKIMKSKKNVEKKYNTEIIFLDIPILPISSSQIRGKVKLKKNISYLVPDEVYNIVNRLNLYK